VRVVNSVDTTPEGSYSTGGALHDPGGVHSLVSGNTCSGSRRIFDLQKGFTLVVFTTKLIKQI
jgi:hypothetical protein